MVKSATQPKTLEWNLEGKLSDVVVKGQFFEHKWRYLFLILPLVGICAVLWVMVNEYRAKGLHSLTLISFLILISIFLLFYLFSLRNPRKIWYELRENEILIQFDRTRPFADYFTKGFEDSLSNNFTGGFFFTGDVNSSCRNLHIPYKSIISITKEQGAFILNSSNPNFIKSAKLILPKDNAKDIEQFLATKTKFLQTIKKR